MMIEHNASPLALTSGISNVTSAWKPKVVHNWHGGYPARQLRYTSMVLDLLSTSKPDQRRRCILILSVSLNATRLPFHSTELHAPQGLALPLLLSAACAPATPIAAAADTRPLAP